MTGAASRRLRERMGRLFLSAIHKSSGKTTVSLGLAAALTARGLAVQTFKKGPDYIDPMWLERASGRPCYNLDFNTQSEAEIVAAFRRCAQGKDVTLIEGNKGLHDGMDPRGSDSSAALAKLLGAPVVLIVDVIGMMRGIAPLVLGYATFDPGVRLGGVILNKIGLPRQESKLRQALENYTDIPVLGAIGRDEDLSVNERHLGLTPPNETADLRATVNRIGDVVARGVDVDRLIEIAASAGHVDAPEPIKPVGVADLRIAVARDAAFGFYYADDFLALERAGAQLIFFDAVRDEKLPAADALFIGGGFPETQAAALAANTSLRGQVREAIAGGLPTYAECGGLMYLTRSIHWRGETHEMVGVIPADTVVRDRPQGRGLVLLEETGEGPWPNRSETAPIAAHEFHHAALENVDPNCRFAYRMRRGFGVDGKSDGIVIGNMLASFSHLRDTSRHHWADRFVSFIRERRVGAPKDPPISRLIAAE
ncbi:cobyrinate a,c-diamide synthase [Methylovirgula sp. HY1]|uniref:cobyrinate a,c-diamide synthase n=1 Tax=Methylovirgula sp. HY1 TaxID=2822761 RepID=UPI001C743234|nr:cobyrinate a,c-diamide synthase [Methylovirgula sp. HY1]QXX73297.1 Protein similar to cobyrinic acid a,c-diamide synthetase clustered with dissimilatory sulfite reductase [Methylovirgula sp. HY1]